MMCKSDAKLRSGIRDLEQNKHQLLHRIQSVWTSLIYNIISSKEYVETWSQNDLNNEIILFPSRRVNRFSNKNLNKGQGQLKA